MFRRRPRHRAPSGAPPAMQSWQRARPVGSEPLLRVAVAGLAGWFLDVPVHHASRAWQSATHAQ